MKFLLFLFILSGSLLAVGEVNKCYNALLTKYHAAPQSITLEDAKTLVVAARRENEELLLSGTEALKKIALLSEHNRKLFQENALTEIGAFVTESEKVAQEGAHWRRKSRADGGSSYYRFAHGRREVKITKGMNPEPVDN